MTSIIRVRDADSATPGMRSAGDHYLVQIPRSVKPVLQEIGRLAEAAGPAYAVGGCVRDWCLKAARTPDLDVTIEGDGVQLARLLAARWRAELRLHPQFGTATVLRARGGVRRVDVATCRQETYARSAAYPRVTRGTLENDLFRRDFTFNAMAIALNPARFGTLIDPFDGLADLRRRRLRMLHPLSFRDDPSRILRGIRFAHRFHCRFEAATLQQLRDAVSRGALGWLNAGRLGRELERMLHEPDPLACLRELAGYLGG